MITGMPRIAIATPDFDGAISTFRDKLGMPVVDISDSSVESLGARLAMCVPDGGSNIELMSPARPDAPLSQSLNRFLETRGPGLFALMLEAAVPDDEAVQLRARGLNVLPLMPGAGGRDVHPNSTHGVLVRVYPTNSYPAPVSVDRSSDFSGIQRVIIAVKDLDRALQVYAQGFGLPVTPPVRDELRGVVVAHCSPPTGGRIELVSSYDDTRPFAQSIVRFQAQRSEGLFAIVLEAEEPTTEGKRLALTGLEVTAVEGEPGTVEISTMGTRIRIEPT
jgi:catechol 2,3-dioxygenase-like lactoylglutathione lyase family enzyme